MKTRLSILAAACALTSASAQAHFQLVYTPEVMLPEPAEVEFKLVFGHPMENGHVMDTRHGHG